MLQPNPLNTLVILIKPWQEASQEAYLIREQVFIQEQGVPKDMELDEFDLAAKHALAYEGPLCVGTGRLVHLDNHHAQIGRMAVLSAFRNQGIGKAILNHLIALAQAEGVLRLVLHSQVSVIPFYAKLALISISAFAFLYTIYIGQRIILPIVYATIIAILLNPVVNLFLKIRINKVVAITIAVMFAIILTLGLLYFISIQVSLFSETYPVLKEKYNASSLHLINWISQNFNIEVYKINDWIKETENSAIRNMGGSIGQTLSTINGFLIVVVLLPVYLFMILFYKPLLLEFIHRLFKSTYQKEVLEVLNNSKRIIQSYLVGLLLEAVIIATLNSVGLLILGIDYAVILGVTGALLNVIPYIGGVIAIALPMIMAFVTKDATSAILVLGVYVLIQFIDNHFIIPSIVASKVKINALVSVIVVIVGGALCGIPGMFLSIPVTAIIKVVCDHVESLKPWGYLLGNIVPTKILKLNFPKINIK